MSKRAGLVFGLRARVTRGPYLLWGFALAALKLCIDAGTFFAFTGSLGNPLGYVLPSLVLRGKLEDGSVPNALYVVLIVVGLPFLWAGLSMSVRRAADAGISPWFGVGFLIPLLNYVTIAVLAVLPSKATARWEPRAAAGPYRDGASSEGPPSTVELPPKLGAALMGLGACMGLGVSMVAFSVYGLGAYGAALFFATPFTMGAVTAAIYNGRHVQSFASTIGLALLGTLMTGGAILLFAIEGVICLVMALPISGVLAIIGAVVAWVITTSARSAPSRTAAMVLALPALAAGEATVSVPTLRHVTTTIEIDAPPERVWPNVVGFSELPAPPWWMQRLGIAYPVRARISGSGVGALRHCEFSTGPFVEPITVWDEPRRLAFDVVSQPPSMTEWSPYASVNAPHVEGYMVSKGGQFDLVALPGGRTRLEGTTHYTLDISPELYWVIYGEALLHGIHGRVLSHVKNLSEAR